MTRVLNRKIVIFLSVILVLISGCKAKKDSQSSDDAKKGENPESTFEAQAKVIVDNIESWRLFKGNEEDQDLSSCGYAMTDLDHNGRAELMVVSNNGNGNYSECHFYEITEDYKSLKELEWKRTGLDEGFAEPDLLDLMDVSVYTDDSANEYHYMCQDSDYQNAGAGQILKCDLMIKDGIVNVHSFARVYFDNTDGDDIEEFSIDGKEHATEKDFESAEKEHFKGYSSFFCRIGFVPDCAYHVDYDFTHFEDRSKETQAKELVSSYKVFTGKMDHEEFVKICQNDENRKPKENAITRDTWYVGKLNKSGEKGYTAVRAETVFNEVVLDAYNIIGDSGNEYAQDYFAVEASFTGEGDAAVCKAFSGFSNGGEYWDDTPVTCGIVMGSDFVDIGDQKYTDGPFKKIDGVPGPLKSLYETGDMLEKGDEPDFLGTWYAKASNGRLFEFEFMEDGRLVYAYKISGSPVEVYSGRYSYNKNSGAISCITNRFGWGTMPFEEEFKLNNIAEGRLSLSGEVFPDGKLLLSTEPVYGSVD